MKKEDLIKLKERLSKLSEDEIIKRDLYLRKLANGDIQGPSVGYPSIDKPWLKYYSEEKMQEKIPNKSIYQLAYDSNKDNMDGIALDMRISKNEFKKGIKISYDKFFKNIYGIAKSLKALNIEKEEIIPLLLPNIPEARYLIYANSYIGSTSYPISPLLPENELKRIINENNIQTVFMFKDFYGKYENAINLDSIKNVIILDGTESLPLLVRKVMQKKDKSLSDKCVSWDQFINYGKKVIEKIQPYYNENHIAAIIGTSGTTGTSKGVCLTDKNINTVALAYKNSEYFEGNMMDALIPSIGYGISMIHYQTVDSKYVYLIPELITDKFPLALKNTKANNFPGGPVHSINLAKQNIKKDDIPFVNNLVSGGASLPKNIEEELNGVSKGYSENGAVNKNLIVRQGYGLSENTAMGSYSKHGSYKFGSIGIPPIYESVGVFKPDTDIELEYNTPGEICIQSGSVMKEYLNNKEETDKVVKIHSDGKRWIHTKDIGYVDEDGNIFHVDRIKNIFMRCGFNVHPAKIAEYLNTIDFIDESTVIGFEHPTEQSVPVAFIKLNKEQTNGKTIEEIKTIINNLCFRDLEETSVPYDYLFVDELPINVGGKIDQRKLKEESKINYMETYFNQTAKVLEKK